MPFDPGTLVGVTLERKYRIEGLMGRGGMGAVLRATHVGTGRTVAVKVLLPGLVGNAEAVERFRREARAAGALRHPNIVNVTDFGVAEVDGAPVAYLVMEHLEGEPLSALLSRVGQLPVRLVADLVEQVALALEQAHALGIVHRDLKPDNIWLCLDPRGGHAVRVLDFGIAKLSETVEHPSEATEGLDGDTPAAVDGDPELTVDLHAARSSAADDPERTVDLPTPAPASATPGPSASALTTAGTIIGTPAYMSPEQISGREVDRRSDIYSLAVVAWEALTGRRPFVGSLGELAEKHRHEAPRPASSLNPAVPPQADAVLARALAKDPAHRHPSARAFAGALQVARERPGVLVRKALSLYLDHLPLLVGISVRASALPLAVIVPLAAAAMVIGLPFAIPVIVIGTMFVWALVAIAVNGAFAVAVERHRFRPLEPFTAGELFDDIAARLGLPAGTSRVRSWLALTRTYFRAELASPPGLGDLGFVVAFLEGRPRDELPDRCTQLAGGVKRAYGQIKAILFVILILVPLTEACVVFALLTALGLGTMAFPLAYVVGMGLIPFNAVLLNPVLAIALTQLYYRARQANGEDVEAAPSR